MILALPARLLVAGCALQASGDELIPNGSIEGREPWRPWPSVQEEGVILSFDPSEGAQAPGSLHIESNDPSPWGVAWGVKVELPSERPTRLVLAANVRARGFAEGTRAQVLAVIPAQGPPFPSTKVIGEDTDWRLTRVVFDVPEGVERVQVLAQLIGVGHVWFDDLSLKATDEEPSEVAHPGWDWGTVPEEAARWEALARKAASEIPWLFDGKAARERAAREGKPILVYLRSTDDWAGLASMQTTLEGRDTSLMDNGYAKDLLFRAGPLSEPEVSALLTERFVPVCLTYHLGASSSSTDTPPGWSVSGMEGARLWASANEGGRAPGCLAIEIAEPADPRQFIAATWIQYVKWTGEGPVTLRLAARLRTADLLLYSGAHVQVQCLIDHKDVAYGDLPGVRRDTNWAAQGTSWAIQETTFEVPEGVDTLVLLASLDRPGRVWFDDLEIARPGVEGNLLLNGTLDRLESEAASFGLDVSQLTTPAVVAFAPDGTRVAHLHRIGTLSDDLLFRWLCDVLAEVTPDEPVPEYLADDSGLRRALAHLRLGEWSSALAVLKPLGEDASERARFWRGWCLYRQGLHRAARAEWEALVGDTTYGRKAAACLLPQGPRLLEAATFRAWPETDGRQTQSEGAVSSFDPNRSIGALLELQRSEGSFGAHLGLGGYGWNENPAITALAIDALRAWESHSVPDLASEMDAACERAQAWLVGWAGEDRSPRVSTGAFNNPYVFRTLLAAGEQEAAALMVQHVLATQFVNGAWGHYGSNSPASFITALNIIALLRASDAGLEVPVASIESGLDALEAMRQEGGLFPYTTEYDYKRMTTAHGSIARDSLCERALLEGGRGSVEALESALARYWRHAHNLREPTKRDHYHDANGYGSHYFFFAHRNAIDAARAYAGEEATNRTLHLARELVLAAQEGDGTFMDAFLLGRAYGTAQALLVFADD